MFDFMGRKLNMQLIPSTAWYSNLRTLIDNWSEISNIVRSKCCCDICKKTGTINEFDAHEVWEFNDNSFEQSLKKIICVCKDCHSAIHMGHTLITCDENTINRIKKHYMTVNNITEEQMKKDIKEAFDFHAYLSQFDWNIHETRTIHYVEKTYNVSCDVSKSIDGKWYAKVDFSENYVAKRYGAKWDNIKKLWYFKTEQERTKWYNREKD